MASQLMVPRFSHLASPPIGGAYLCLLAPGRMQLAQFCGLAQACCRNNLRTDLCKRETAYNIVCSRVGEMRP